MVGAKIFTYKITSRDRNKQTATKSANCIHTQILDKMCSVVDIAVKIGLKLADGYGTNDEILPGVNCLGHSMQCSFYC